VDCSNVVLEQLAGEELGDEAASGTGFQSPDRYNKPTSVQINAYSCFLPSDYLPLVVVLPLSFSCKLC